MRIHVVSDVHGAAEELARAADGADLFICLGDLILFLDYDNPERGIHSDLFGADHTRAYIAARTAGRFEDARELSAAAWARRGIVDPRDRWAVLEGMVAAQYAELFAAMPAPALLTYGNVDVPGLWPDFLREGHRVVDGEMVEVDGLRLGFVGGGLISPMRTPYELTPEEYAAKIEALGEVDILFTHVPPKVPELNYDVIARRFEIGSMAVREYIDRVQPAYALFGHVHQPLQPRFRIGRTECLNVGHFHGTGTPFVLEV
ncbi:MAG: metallophosphoesterase [Actinomycetes bacterium]